MYVYIYICTYIYVDSTCQRRAPRGLAGTPSGGGGGGGLRQLQCARASRGHARVRQLGGGGQVSVCDH